MKTWAMMYGMIWVAFFQIIIVLFPVAGEWPADIVHAGLGVILLFMSYGINKQVRATTCPARVKRIVGATFRFCIFQAVLGVVLFTFLLESVGGVELEFVQFLHVAVAITIITQASSSATAYDMWEEKEFAVPTEPSEKAST